MVLTMSPPYQEMKRRESDSRISTGTCVSESASSSAGVCSRVSYSVEANKTSQAQTMEELKGCISANVYKAKYDVKDYYFTKGMWQRIARDQRFENASLFVIFLNGRCTC